MSKTPTSHEVWSREQRAKQHEQRMALRKAEPVRGVKPEAKRPVKLKGKAVLIEALSPAAKEEFEKALNEGIKDAAAVVAKAIREHKRPVEQLQQLADAVPAKKGRGRPPTRSAEDRKAYDRELKRKKRAAAKEAK